jgi:hypothetical protein
MSYDPAKMVGWYSPRLLLKAATEVVVSTLFGRHADQRTVHALSGPAKLSDYSRGQRREVDVGQMRVNSSRSQQADSEIDTAINEPIWIDYVADTGDGWDSTYSIAWAVTRPQLKVKTRGQTNPITTTQGSILIFGGDQVYPTAARREYERRFVAPYQRALSDGAIRPDVDVFAIPGNHDWYDSLCSFSRIFFAEGAFVNASGVKTETPQTRSYFAIKLPHGWWILGTDVQLGSDIDANQLKYFRDVASGFGPHDKVVLFTPEPHWSPAKKKEKRESLAALTALDQLEQEVLGDRVRVFVAGDVHHYMRFESDQPRVHKITAGGGGAFLHPTHRTWGRTIREQPNAGKRPARTFKRPDGALFPSASRSQILAFRNWFFALANPRFGAITAVLYCLFALMMMPAFMRHERKQIGPREAKLKSEIDESRETWSDLVRTLSTPNPDLAVAPDPSAIADIAEQRQRVMNEAKEAAGEWEKNNPIGSKHVEETLRKAQHLNTQLEKNERALEHLGGYVARMGNAYHSAVEQSATAQPKPQPEQPPSSDRQVPDPSQAHESSIPSFGWMVQYLGKITKQELALPDPFQSMLAILVFLSVLAGFVAFTDVPNLLGRFLLGSLHGATHWFAAYLIAIIAAPLLLFWSTELWILVTACGLMVAVACAFTADKAYSKWFSRAFPSAMIFAALVFIVFSISHQNEFKNLSVVIVVFVIGWVVGSFITGAYLFFVHTAFGVHWNESFSAVKCKDWKCFLRFRLTPNELTIYPIGIAKVCRKWRERGDHVEPASSASLDPILIEPPIIIR